MNFFNFFKTPQVIEKVINRNKEIYIYHSETSVQYFVEQIALKRTVAQIKNEHFPHEKKYLSVKLLEHKQDIGKRRLEDFEVLSEVVEKTSARGVAVKVFFFSPQNINPQVPSKKTNSLPQMKRANQGNEAEAHCFFKKLIRVRREDQNSL